jgi:hypothetical protein
MQLASISGRLSKTFKNQTEEKKKDYLLKNLYDGKSIGSLNFNAKWLLFGENDKIKIAKRKNLQYIY